MKSTKTIILGLMLLLFCGNVWGIDAVVVPNTQPTQTQSQMTTQTQTMVQDQVQVTVMPDNPLYGLKLFIEDITESFNPELKQVHEQKRLIELDAMVQKQDGLSADKVFERIQERASVQAQVQANEKINQGFEINQDFLDNLKNQLNQKYANRYNFMDGVVLVQVNDASYDVKLNNDRIESIIQSSGNNVYLASVQLSPAELYGTSNMNLVQAIGLYNQLRNQNRIQIKNLGNFQSMGDIDAVVQNQLKTKLQGE